MRLLAHGGTLLDERARIGDWPPIASALLEEKYGLEGDNKKITGVGLKGGTPFLIIRELQRNVGRRYAYTLLLDPGEDIWAVHGWNGARIISAIVQAAIAGDDVPSRLFQAPNKLSSSEILEWLGTIKSPQPGSPPQEKAVLISEFLTGSIFLDTPLAVGPAGLNWVQRPSTAELASALESLPVALRVGRGWLSGGSKEQAKAFGAALVFDDEISETSADATALAEKGRASVKAFGLIAASPELRECLNQVTPLWATENPAAQFEQLNPVVKWLKDASGEVELVRRFGRGTGVFRDLVSDCALLALQHGKAALDAATTRSILDYHIDGQYSLGTALGRLDKVTLRNLIQERFDGKPPAFLGIPDYRFEIRLEELKKLNGGLSKRLTSVQEENKWSEAEESHLRNAAWARSVELGEPLSEWQDHADRLAWAELGKLMEEEANRRARGRVGPNWPVEFFAYGSSEAVGDVLGKLALGDLEQAVALAIEKSAQPGSCASEFISKLAISKRRSELNISLKKQVAEMASRSGIGTWEPFRAVVALIDGDDAEFVEVAPEDLKALRAEIPDLLKLTTCTPNLLKLMEWNDLLDKSTFKCFEQRVFEPTNSWCEGLKLANGRGWVDRKTFVINLLETAEKDLSRGKGWTLDVELVDSSVLADRLYMHLFDDKLTNNNSPTIVRHMSIAWKANPKFKKCLEDAISRGLNILSAREVFSRRFFSEESTPAEVNLGPLFAAIPESLSADVITALFQYEGNDVPKLLKEIMLERHMVPSTGQSFRRAVLAFIVLGQHPLTLGLAKQHEYGGKIDKLKEAAKQRLAALIPKR